MIPLGMRLTERWGDAKKVDPLTMTEEEAYARYAPDTAFAVDLSLLGTNTVSVKPAVNGNPWTGTMKIDWGDGTVIENAGMTWYGYTYTHTYADQGVYVIRMGPAPIPLYSLESTTKKAVVRVLRFADGGQNGATVMPVFNDCPNLTAFPDGRLARWPSGFKTIGSVYDSCKSLAATSVPDWPEGVTRIGATYGRCPKVRLTRLPAWPSTLKTLESGYWSGCYAYADLQLAELPAWPEGLEEITGSPGGGKTRACSRTRRG